MDCCSAREAAERWGVSLRYVQRLLKEGRVPGARKYGVSWMLPADAPKPEDPRRAKGTPRDDYPFWIATDLPKGRPEDALMHVPAALHPLAEADLAYRRGEAEPAIALWHQLPASSEAKLSATSLAAAAAISAGDYPLYNELLRFLGECRDRMAVPSPLLELPETMAAVSMGVPALTPDWLKQRDFDGYPYALRPFLLYLYAVHVRNTGSAETLLATASTALLLCQREDTFSWLDLNLGMLCASAAYRLGDQALCVRQLNTVLTLAMPYGLIAPLADYLGELGAPMQEVLRARWPEGRKPVAALWESSFKHWIDFHNRFAVRHVTTLLTPQEYHVARLLLDGLSYAEIAGRLHLSAGRIKNIVSAIYGKLGITRRQALRGFIL